MVMMDMIDIKLRTIMINTQTDQIIKQEVEEWIDPKTCKQICKVLDKISDLLFLKDKQLQKEIWQPL
jgi:hypothetical protein